MKRSAKTEYACLAMMQLATAYASGEPVRIRRIAQEHGIPSRLLIILIPLSLLQPQTFGFRLDQSLQALSFRAEHLHFMQRLRDVDSSNQRDTLIDTIKWRERILQVQQQATVGRGNTDLNGFDLTNQHHI